MADTTLRVRPATREDLPDIVWCSRSSTDDDEVRGFGEPMEELTFAKLDRLTLAWDSGMVGPSRIRVAELKSRVVAYATIEDRGQELELGNIDVAGEFQGQGIGSALVAFIESEARHQEKRAVTTGTSRNSAGVPWKSFPWWQRRGYQVTGEEQNAWTRKFGGSEIRMKKALARENEG